eukprot:CAMPEP_0183513180 /NCGR_PEP_ID=MMETSP0371-20130417/12039_1 /TAXON_ID=268820 /ORGANISM="Peridinium aciculiferum, Strain PAER-2" /LENGTH=59 /DNA_ID=CAMNT_0025710375 /DNA_START=18 /DNA_END=194 /DNA_ORIENTATION=-
MVARRMAAILVLALLASSLASESSSQDESYADPPVLLRGNSGQLDKSNLTHSSMNGRLG